MEPGVYVHDLQPSSPMAMDSVFAGVPGSHAPALLVPLLLPIFIGVGMNVVYSVTRWRAAAAFVAGYERASSLTRVTAVLLLLAGGIHLALVVPHWSIDRSLAVLFGTDGLALVFVAIASCVWPGWRGLAVMLLTLTLVAYLGYLAMGAETPDTVGTATYVIEIVALGLVWVPHAGAPPDADRVESRTLGML